MNWNDSWVNELKDDNYEVWERLAECRSTKKDMIIMARFLWEYNPDKTAEEALDRIIEWVTDWNSQYYLYPDEYEYRKMLLKVQEDY